jgi:tRNA wybutosine-synthesizing protein 1
VEETIRNHLTILTGYKDNPKTNRQKLKEALTPKHVAISLSGEPTLYDHLDELIRIFHEKKFTTFLVSNGTVPSTLGKLSHEPTQLYVSVCAPDETTFKTVCRPQISNGWKKLNKTLETLPSFRCPTVMRITCAQGLNMKNAEGYSNLINKAEPTYIEAKAYMHVGYSRRRLSYDKMPSHTEVREFSKQLAQLTGYNLIDESSESRVVLLSKLEISRRFADGCFFCNLIIFQPNVCVFLLSS